MSEDRKQFLEKLNEYYTDQNHIDVTKEVNLVLSIANSLRGSFEAEKYKDVIIPMVIIRRFECALEETKESFIEYYENNPSKPAQFYEKKTGYPFYNTSKYSLKKLLDDSDSIESNFNSYIDGFSENVKEILNNLEIKNQIKKMNKNNRLYNVVKKFSEIDFNPKTVDNHKMGYIFEDIIRRYSENVDAGDHYTPREVIRLMVEILLAENCDDILTGDSKVVTVLDAACGSGGMLSTTHDYIKLKNSSADVRLFGQEILESSYAICAADMLIKGQDIRNIKGGEKIANTLKKDCFENQKMRFVIMNPPFGTPWGGKDAPEGQEKAVKDEYKKGVEGRFGAGLPATTDAQLLFMQHAVNKLSSDGRAAIITNGSPLFSGGTTSGESQIRRWLLENDYVEAIIALPNQLFYNTDIGIYIFVISRNKRSDRRGKVQLINAVDMYKPLRKSLGKKRREIDLESRKEIAKIYADFKENENCKIFPNEEFMYKEYVVYQPLQRTGRLDLEAIEELEKSDLFTQNSNIFNQIEFEELIEMNPRDKDCEKKYQKYINGQKFTKEVINLLKKNATNDRFNDYSVFEKKIKSILRNVEGYSDSRLGNICLELSEIDKKAIVQKDNKGKVKIDTTTKDSEIVKLSQDVDDYFEKEVLPHIPDAIYFYDFDENKKISSTNKEKLGAEIPFTRYFYKYVAPESSDKLLSEFFELEKELADDISNLLKSEV
ncbi:MULTISPECIES: class I SAM-dependent DNA methyltransferase [Bacillota]|uniref:type I restriction-modification system subunit M n=1 Tax=Bacillota TaxID=1239 RepID=UPI001CB644FF|nr:MULTISPECIES: class I SAM-dependent DNA methyltransferase [Bacillota]MBF1086448.1 SAM-dependent DNA methyltransferase [Solobacterium sp.]MBF1107526.1 SAM-dependent DNA methyltransferase [Solobacterium sp.]MDU4399139.1 class I SAM-dependent DNA methyltransferase [Veillonella sp.]